MGRICAWCGSVIRRVSSSGDPVSHVLCNGCLADLRSALGSHGLRPRAQPDQPNA
jgi:hypothetical protein